MKIVITILIFISAVIPVNAQRITREYNNVSLSEALRQLNEQTEEYTISFLYNELEDFRITTSVHHKTVPDAIRQMIGFYPIRMTIDPGIVNPSQQEIIVECSQKTAPRYKGTIIDTDGIWGFCPSNFVSGFPLPEISLVARPVLDENEVSFEDGEFIIMPYISGPGTYSFTFLASNSLGTASADLAVTVVANLAPFELWLSERHLDPDTPPSTLAINEQTYYWNYIADIDPTSTNLLELSFTSANDGTFEISPLSPDRSYQLLYYTNILSSPVTNDLTPSAPSTMTFPLDGTGFGRLRVTP